MPSHPNRSQQIRPREHLRAAGALYPGAWKLLDQFRASRGRDGLPDWPDWCYLPMAAAYAVVSGGGDHRITDMELAGDVGRLAALAAWRPTQGIYRFDPYLYRALIDTPGTGDLPADILQAMPEWCIYIETPDGDWFGAPMSGFFAHLEWDANSRREELRLLLDLTQNGDYYLQPLPIHLGGGIEAGIEAASIEAQRQAWRFKSPETANDLRRIKGDLELTPLISLLLYICSTNAEIGGESRRPERPRPKKTKKGWRLFPADKPTSWDVGIRIGAALRRGYESTGSGDGTHASPRPHIRRAHWHTYRVGPGREQSQLKWLPPIPVNVDDADLPIVVRPVE